MISFNLTDEQKVLQQTVREFALREIRPLARKLDEGRHDSWGLAQPMLQKAAYMGLFGLLVPEAYGGGGLGAVDNVLIQEELGTADVGMASSYFNLTMTLPGLLLIGGTEGQKQQWLPQFCQNEVHLLAGAQSEPNVAGSDLFCPTPDPAIGMKAYARREGDSYVVNGRKSAFVTNAGVANTYFLLCRTNLDAPPQTSTTIFLLPADTPGLSFGPKTELMGMRAAYHSEIILDEVRIPAANRLGEEGQAGMIMAMGSGAMTVGLAANFVGLARAAYEYALAYAKERVSWGRPIIEHQAVGLKLANVAVEVQAARLLVWDAAVAVDAGDPSAVTFKAPAAKTYAADTAINAAQTALEILGAYGVTKEYETEKYLRDAWMGYACDFTREVLRLGMVPFL
jgi:alkylation response protein AidB-like acyl-CoA dehydrogenase